MENEKKPRRDQGTTSTSQKNYREQNWGGRKVFYTDEGRAIAFGRKSGRPKTPGEGGMSSLRNTFLDSHKV